MGSPLSVLSCQQILSEDLRRSTPWSLLCTSVRLAMSHQVEVGCQLRPPVAERYIQRESGRRAAVLRARRAVSRAAYDDTLHSAAAKQRAQQTMQNGAASESFLVSRINMSSRRLSSRARAGPACAVPVAVLTGA